MNNSLPQRRETNMEVKTTTNNPPTLNTTDDDDVTTTPTNTFKKYDSIEYTLKFVFRPKGLPNPELVSIGHSTILNLITEHFPDALVYTNKFSSDPYKGPQSLKIESHLKYLEHFTISHSPGDNSGKRSPIYEVYHRVVTSDSLSNIRNHPNIKAQLKEYNCRIVNHQWSENDRDIKHLGFLLDVDPRNYRSTDLHEQLCNKLTKENNLMTSDQLPAFRVGMTSPFLRKNGITHRTRAYDIQCHQKDVQKMKKLIAHAFKKEKTFMFHKMRHENELAYLGAIQRQNYYLDTTMTIPVENISEDVMFYLKDAIGQDSLVNIDGVKDVLKHNRMTTTGRWNIQVDRQKFDSVCKFLRQKLETLCADICHSNNLDQFGGSPHIALRARADDASQGSFNTYMSTCTVQEMTGIIPELDRYDEPLQMPAPTLTTPPTTGYWGAATPVAVMTPPTQTATGVSPMTSDSRSMATSMAEMSRQIEQLIKMNQQQAAELAELRSKATAKPSPVRPANKQGTTLSQADLKILSTMLTDQVTQAVDQRMDKMDQRMDRRMDQRITQHVTHLNSPIEFSPPMDNQLTTGRQDLDQTMASNLSDIQNE
mmetsp:Transcript_18791/g.51449  ORF Transcript_18791/g.51449 Transcript_18791/m.51449 type:complete len:595 (+) Transcript_18791:762-2546(+)